MGRLLLFVAIMWGGWYALEAADISVDPRGVGTSVDGREVVRDAGDIEARFRAMGSLDGAYMLFGGDATRRRNGIAHAIVAGLPLRHARLIAARYPDFHLCKSPGAANAQRFTESLQVVAADRAARDTLEEAIELFEARLGSGGERTCIELGGSQLSLDSVRVQENGADLTNELGAAYRESQFVLAQRVKLVDCQALLH